ncbi:MAG: DNA internalization-related competence protein ComEC/Rec2 [Vicinamibacterales bacterium]
MRVVAAVPAVGLLAGAAAGLIEPETARAPVTISLIAALGAAWSLFWTRHVIAFVVAAGLSFTAGGWLLAADAWERAWRPDLRTAFESIAGQPLDETVTGGEERGLQVEVVGTLRTDATRRERGASLLVDVESIRPTSESPGRPLTATGGASLNVGGELIAERIGEWRAGRVLRFPAQLRRPSRYLNPGVPDAERSLALQGITLVGSIKSAVLVDLVSRGSLFQEATASARARVREIIAATVGPWSTRSAAIVTAILIGDRGGLDVDLQRKLQEAGTYHVIAISGGNIAILTAVILGLFRIAGVLNRAALLAAIAVLALYSQVVGVEGGRSVERATLMAIVYLAGRLVDVQGISANVLAAVVAILVVCQPLAIADPGFLLTCGATAGILFVVPVVQAWRLPRPLTPIVTLLAASIAAEAVLMPIGSSFFSRVTFAGLLLNFVAVPLMAVVQVAGMAVVPLAGLLPSSAAIVGWIAHMGAEGLVRSADLVDVAPWLTWRIVPPSVPGLVVYYACLCVTVWLWHRRREASGHLESAAARRIRLVASTGVACASLWILAEPWSLIGQRTDRLRVTFLDVGQGDATLVRFPRGDTMLVDAGGLAASSFDIGDRVVAPVLRHAGVRRLGTAVLSHAHPDHAGGMPSVIREFRPRDVWDGVPVPPFGFWNELRTLAADVGARWTTVQRRDRVVVDDVEVIVYHPPLPDWQRQDVRNDDSIVLELRWGSVSIVLPGDVGREVEAEIEAMFEPAPVRVLKVPHHGSLTSSSPEFLRVLRPGVAIVSAGRGNAYGHPAPAVLERYREAGAEVFRTDLDGAVSISTDGRHVEVAGYTGRRLTLALH